MWQTRVISSLAATHKSLLVNAPLTLRDLAEAACLDKARNTKDAFAAASRQELLPHATTTQRPTIKVLQTTKITKLGILPLPIGF